MDLVESERNKNIFYGDIFVINEIGCLVFGHGKTKVCRNYTGPKTEEIALDMACLTKEHGKLYGHFEMAFGLKGRRDPIEDKVEIGYLIRMLSEEETKANKTMKPVEISLEDFTDISEFNITFSISNSMMPAKDYDKLIFFKGLTDGVNAKCCAVPWCETLEERGNMLTSCVKAEKTDI